MWTSRGLSPDPVHGKRRRKRSETHPPWARTVSSRGTCHFNSRARRSGMLKFRQPADHLADAAGNVAALIQGSSERPVDARR